MRTRPVYYSQLDPRWRDTLYDINPADGADFLKTTGCGPTTAAMVVATLCDSAVTPPDIAAFAIGRGDRTPSNGTARSLFRHVAQAYGLEFCQTASYDEARAILEAGGLVAVHVKKSRWTGGGHYILWWNVEDGCVCINDPSGDTDRRGKAPERELKAAARAYLCFQRPEREEAPMTYEEWKACYERYMVELGAAEPGAWSDRQRAWALAQRVIQGDENGNAMWKAPITREEYAVTEYRQATGDYD